MIKNPKVLILTAHYGNGHVQVAKTLAQTFRQKGIEDVIVCDLFGESHPVITDITKYLYLKSYTIGKELYRLFYYGVEKIYDKKIASWYANFGRKRLKALLHAEKPDIVINTFPIIAVPELKKQTGFSIPVYNVLTDFCLHKIWIHREVDRYFVATDHVKKVMVEIGVPSEQIVETGIPIRKNFELTINPEILYSKYHLSREKKILLIVAGAHGVLGNVKELCQSFMTVPNLQIAVVCGKNEALKQELLGLKEQKPEALTVFGYVENIDELFRITSCMITKPGGITLSEAAALQVPVILYKPVPGQENENAIYFEKKGAALVIREDEDIFAKTKALLEDDRKLLQMKEAMGSIYRPEPACHIVDAILEENHVQSNHMPIKSPALAQSFT
ncbi:diglucosyl diacylglycerol synthase [Bacillus pseudomycoides]|uniref:Processive diacylglycerol beta-glucosyltransferase n=1 Tax=Bacillus pseudomycoides TaxID=64104 RepID=A0AAJ2DND6_9BACI|nr:MULTISPECIES: diglucosyl diacylglycerol synthase [Bacillus]AIK35820.1 processive diacylglycerol glucosyltransferase [Bacillus pseudomycoides]AJI15903.1 processive diacylglycerol glucosyltransferase [Bacillus pseudomycoides]KFN13273.1 processive diacylglycerol glucosyltransferase [Bacillus pseudomycoides]MCR8859030.1 diglucosyl diacylglycerol synthase [Bacillus pseudomycoides]MCX2827856.1 diglucosyl diacylglycerol synthase [Bacillus sp. DHT2]